MNTDSSNPEQEYDDDFIALLEAVWGEGFLSPGGTTEVDRIVEGLDLTGATILDIGCGVGGADIHLASSYAPAKVIGVDIEEDLIRRCDARAQSAGVGELCDFRCVSPGPLPIADESVEVVFSKDAIIHIADKDALAVDIARVLKPGGWFAASDWLAGYEGEPSAEMRDYVIAEGLDFELATAKAYSTALAAAGFVDIVVDDRNEWARKHARLDREKLTGPLFDNLVSEVGREFLEHEIDVWSKLIVALDQGQIRPTHLRARKAI